MREIKFRAWEPVTKSMILSREYLTGFFLTVKDNPQCTVMQYTELKDKNGKESYWDDIVDDGINPPFVITQDYHLLARLSEIEFKVIGNIYENPELRIGE